MRRTILTYFTLILVVLISTVIVWLPFILRVNSWFGLQINNSNFQYILKNYDGPLYIVPAKTLYNPHLIESLGLELTLPVKYFAAHLPLYPLFILFFASVFGYLKSMIFVNLAFTILLVLFFYYFLKYFQLSRKPFVLVSVFLFLPRYLVVRTVGAPESMFILFILVSLFFFEKKNYLLAGIFGGLATMVKTPGILLFFAYLLTLGEMWIPKLKVQISRLQISFKRVLNLIFLFFIPAGLLTVFMVYKLQYKDFLAYFHSGDNVHLVSPFSVFNFQKPWVGTIWLEDIIFYFFMYLLAVFTLKELKYRSFYYFTLVFFIAIIFVQHRDISRYSLPIWPMACIAFEKLFTSKKFLLVAVFLMPAIYLFVWDFILGNVMPISNWRPFL